MMTTWGTGEGQVSEVSYILPHTHLLTCLSCTIHSLSHAHSTPLHLHVTTFSHSTYFSLSLVLPPPSPSPSLSTFISLPSVSLHSFFSLHSFLLSLLSLVSPSHSLTLPVTPSSSDFPPPPITFPPDSFLHVVFLPPAPPSPSIFLILPLTSFLLLHIIHSFIIFFHSTFLSLSLLFSTLLFLLFIFILLSSFSHLLALIFLSS